MVTVKPGAPPGRPKASFTAFSFPSEVAENEEASYTLKIANTGEANGYLRTAISVRSGPEEGKVYFYVNALGQWIEIPRYPRAVVLVTSRPVAPNTELDLSGKLKITVQGDYKIGFWAQSSTDGSTWSTDDYREVD